MNVGGAAGFVDGSGKGVGLHKCLIQAKDFNIINMHHFIKYLWPKILPNYKKITGTGPGKDLDLAYTHILASYVLLTNQCILPQ